MTATIVVVDDEQEIVSILEYNLRKSGYATRSAYTGAGALEQIRRDPVPDLVLLDLMLPDISGEEVCRQIRADKRTSNVPVLMLTAKGEEIDRVVGFEVGADDYVVKPFSVRELLLRIRAILKRASQSKEPLAEEIRFGDLVVDLPGHRVHVCKEEIVLTALEFKLLNTLLDRKGRVQTREMLLADVWDVRADITTRTVDTHVKRLREKLGRAGEYILTIRGVGYRFKSSPGEEEP